MKLIFAIAYPKRWKTTQTSLWSSTDTITPESSESVLERERNHQAPQEPAVWGMNELWIMAYILTREYSLRSQLAAVDVSGEAN